MVVGADEIVSSSEQNNSGLERNLLKSHHSCQASPPTRRTNSHRTMVSRELSLGVIHNKIAFCLHASPASLSMDTLTFVSAVRLN